MNRHFMQYGVSTQLFNSLKMVFAPSKSQTGMEFFSFLTSGIFSSFSLNAWMYKPAPFTVHLFIFQTSWKSPVSNASAWSKHPTHCTDTQWAKTKQKRSQINEAIMTSNEALGFAHWTRELPLQDRRPILLSLLLTHSCLLPSLKP